LFDPAITEPRMAGAQPAVHDPAAAAAESVDVLVVDDSPDTCRAIKRLLHTAGHTAACLPDGLAALEYLADRKPCVVLLDLMMPGIDGMEVLRRIRREPALADLPVVLYTAVSDPDVWRQGLKLGAQQVALKSGGWEVLYPLLRPFLTASLPN
jgi:CheY-like chemotaxis protein